VGLALAQTRPNISEIFEAEESLEVQDANSTFFGRGLEYRNQPKGQAVGQFIFSEDRHEENVYMLERYDLGAIYVVEDRKACEKVSVANLTMAPYWNWLRYANYTGRSTFEGLVIGYWEAAVGYAQVGVAIIERTQIPVFTWRRSVQRNTTITFENFQPRVPSNQHWFDVPGECKNVTAPVTVQPQAPAACLEGATVISRAQVWVTAQVPYNQGATYDGYREDCSGFVSMAWGIGGPGKTTSTLPEVSHAITKDELKEGDVLLDTAEHVVIFGGWTNAAKSEYMAYEETKPGEGTVKRATPYPYWYNTAAFKPYRYNNLC